MKTLFIIIVLLACSLGLNAQEVTELKNNAKSSDDLRTLFGNVEHHGGYAATTFRIGDNDGLATYDFGGRAAYIANHSIGLGFAGYGFIQQSVYDVDLQDDYSLQGGYGGFLIEPVIFPRFPIHISVPILIGVGGVAKMQDVTFEQNNYNDPYQDGSCAFMIVEPGIELELSLFKFMRVNAGMYYRQTSDLDIINRNRTALNGFSAGFTLKFGSF